MESRDKNTIIGMIDEVLSLLRLESNIDACGWRTDLTLREICIMNLDNIRTDIGNMEVE